MARKPIKTLIGAAVALTLSVPLVACSGGGGSSASGDQSGDGEISGKITVLTNRTDLVDTTFADYKAAFEAKYPGTEVEFEAITDYEGEVTTRMSSDEYGDVLIIPAGVNVADYSNYFEPLGSYDELSAKYNYLSGYAYDGTVYAIPDNAGVNGIVYNKKVWADAGITDLPTTTDEFITDLKAIKDKTDATPYYTNYAAGWPLSQWEGLVGSVTGDADATNKLADLDAPWAEGEEHNVIDSLLFDIVHEGLSEDDPTTTDWELSKDLLGSGEVSAMVLGSWAIIQMQQAADNPDDIAFMPFPNQVDGKFNVPIAADGPNAINIHSENKATARAWIEYMVEESGYAESQDLIPTVIGAEFPESLAQLDSDDVNLLELNPAPAGKEGLTDSIDKKAEIGLWDATYRQNIVDVARGQADGTKDSVFQTLNDKWAKARQEVEGK